MNKQIKLKLILSSLKQRQLLQFFESFLQKIHCKLYKSIKQISFSCYQSTCQVQNIMVNGYGKTSSEALISGINNIIDSMIDQQEYTQAMRYCLKKLNFADIKDQNNQDSGQGQGYNNSMNINQHNSNYSYSLNNNQSNIKSKKQLLLTQKTMKTLGAQPSMSVEKKILTMSGSLSSNSKDSSIKSSNNPSNNLTKSIKDQIFEYFNLENLKVKNPGNIQNQASPMLSLLSNQLNRNNNKNSNSKVNLISMNNNIINHSKSKEKFMQLRQKQQKQINQAKLIHHHIVSSSNSTSNNMSQLEEVYKKIKLVQQKITKAQLQNQSLKQQILLKKKSTSISISQSLQTQNPNQSQKNYFTRQSIQNQKKSASLYQNGATQSSKKLNYLQSQQHNNNKDFDIQKFKNVMNVEKQKQKIKYAQNKNYLLQPKDQDQECQQENHFQKIDLTNVNVNNIHSKNILTAKLTQNVGTAININQNKIHENQQYKENKNQRRLLINQPTVQNQTNQMKNSTQQRKCLLDISNLTSSYGQNIDYQKNNEKSFNIMKSEFNTISQNNQIKNNQTKMINVFLTESITVNNNGQINNIKDKNNNNALYPIKLLNNCQGQHNESDKKIRSFSMNNHLVQKASNNYNTSVKNPITLLSSVNNLNNSFDHGNSNNPNNSFNFNNNKIKDGLKKIKIPKLNLQILPNYHGKSNKSLNQSLMQNYQKKLQNVSQNNMINIQGQ